MRLDHLLSKENCRQLTRGCLIGEEYSCCSIFFEFPKKFIQSRREETEPQEIPNGGVAQLGEHLPCKQGVMGSNPIISIAYAVRNPSGKA